MANPTYLRFIDNNPDSAAAFKALVAEVIKAGALDAKTKQLIFLACTAVSGYGDGLIAHIDKILAAGGTPDEIRETLAVTIPVAGVMPVLKVYDAVEDHLAKLQA
ncbi:MAG: carboxymuconolactone decarboxylase family protein [Chelatococcus sp.]|uniref:carboxymuconolactone decarboxylase family protein n=1 Tax=Chelatococcus sp. TaxID=1953771 RepID=UPI0025BF8F8C|nr:carboxymuconolactone decarboxylase family protein [Chelatococcus sp.]MBX3538888.1 carboxymuconolactone decarboxylase family protein [Chelatococcus sp.]